MFTVTKEKKEIMIVVRILENVRVLPVESSDVFFFFFLKIIAAYLSYIDTWIVANNSATNKPHYRITENNEIVIEVAPTHQQSI